MEVDAELIVDELLNEWLMAKELKRLLSKCILFSDKKSIRQTKSFAKDALNMYLADKDLPKRLGNADAILNLLPFDQALSIYKELA